MANGAPATFSESEATRGTIRGFALAALGFLALMIYAPPVRDIFHFTTIGWNFFMVPLSAGTLVIFFLEIAKSYFARDLV
ncbi:MAG TPA: hypothetical protein VF452_07985 [Candidatus Binatia bacterium]